MGLRWGAFCQITLTSCFYDNFGKCKPILILFFRYYIRTSSVVAIQWSSDRSWQRTRWKNWSGVSISSRRSRLTNQSAIWQRTRFEPTVSFSSIFASSCWNGRKVVFLWHRLFVLAERNYAMFVVSGIIHGNGVCRLWRLCTQLRRLNFSAIFFFTVR